MTLSRPKVLAGGVLIALLIVGIWLYTSSTGPEPASPVAEVTSAQNNFSSEHQEQPPEAETSAATQAPDEVTYQTPDSLGDEPFAQSLEGTDIDGSLRANARGELIIDLSTRDFFDYFLNTVGEVSPDQALDQIQTLALEHLPEAAAAQAMDLLDNYLAYRQQALELSNRPLDANRRSDPAYQLEVLQTTFADMKQARRQNFTPEAHRGFFAMEEAYGDYTLAVMELRQREDLTQESMQTLMDWHRQQLPEPLRQSEAQQQRNTAQHQQRQQALEVASTPGEAAENLRQLGMEDAQAGQVEHYLQQRQDFTTDFARFQDAVAELNASGVSQEDLKREREALLESHFTDEQTRTWARLEAMGSDTFGDPAP